MKFINRKFVWLILSLIVFSCQTNVQNSLQTNAQDKNFDESVLSANGKNAYQNLLNEELFAFGGIYESGETSDGEKAFDILVEEQEAISAFKSLVKNAKPEGGLYALFGLRMLKCDCFKKEIENFKKLPELPERKSKGENLAIGKGSVARMEGCEMSRQGRLEVAEEIATGKFDDWIKRK